MTQFAGPCEYCIYHEQEALLLRKLVDEIQYAWDRGVMTGAFDKRSVIDQLLSVEYPKIPKGGIK